MKNSHLLIVALAAVLSGCFEQKWSGYVYPNRNDLTDWEYIGIYKSLQECGDAAQSRLQSMNAWQRGDYECGLNCDGGICERTAR